MLCAIKVLEKRSQAVQEVMTRRGSPKEIEGRPRSIENCLMLKLFPNMSVNKSKKTPRNMRTHEPTRVNSSTCSSRRTTGEDTPYAKKPVFESYREAFHKRYGRDERVGVPKSIYLYQTFHGNSEALEDAILKGEVQQWEDEGVLFCGNRKTTAGIEKSSTSGQRLHAGETVLTKNQWNTLSKAFSSMSWDMSALENSGPSSSATSGASASQKPKCLEMAGLTTLRLQEAHF